jgi:N-acyl-D-aspartate/D-glutamate deacylase
MIFCLSLLLVLAPASGADFDLLIRNARVVDGSGNPWYRADIGIKGGKIAAIGGARKDAVRRMTSLPARTFGFRDLLREGYAADLARPHPYSEGIDPALVNGVAAENGKVTGARPRKALRHQP